MDSEAVRKVVIQIGNDLIALAKTILEDDTISTNTKVGRNTLADSALHDQLAKIIDASGDPVISALFNNYVVYIEWTRPPKYKKPPPISALKDWAEKNGIPTDSETLYKISYAIWRDGHKGRPIFATMDREAALLFDSDWSDKLFNVVTADLDLLFND